MNCPTKTEKYCQPTESLLFLRLSVNLVNSQKTVKAWNRNILDEKYYVLCQSLKMVKEANKPISRSLAAVSAKHSLRKNHSQLFIGFVKGRTDQQQIICRQLAIFGLA